MIGWFAHSVDRLLGIPAGISGQRGDWSLRFNPAWPAPQIVGAAIWNLVVAAVAISVIVYVYRRETASQSRRLFLGINRSLLILFVIALLNRPVLTLTQSRVEPSVLAMMIDDSSSMRVPDEKASDRKLPDGSSPSAGISRLAAVQSLLSRSNGELLRGLSRKHSLRLFSFDREARPLSQKKVSGADHEGNSQTITDSTAANRAIASLKPEANSTQVLPSILSVANELQGQQVAGIVLFTDGRDTPVANISADLEKLKAFGIKIYPIAVGSDHQPQNIEVQSMQLDEVAFNGDVVNVKAVVRGTGYEPNHAVHVILKDQKTGEALNRPDGKPAEATINLPDDKPVQVELQWQTSGIGVKQVLVEATKQPGELDDTDNTRTSTVSVMDAKINVLFVDGYPRWDYRYLKNAMLRDKSISVSCLLANADFNFLQEGNKPLPSATANSPGHFPDTLEQLMGYDVLLIGDVDPTYFSDNQLQLMNDFVSKGGGLMMVAGPRFNPQAYRNTPVEPLLPVSISHVESSETTSTITQGFRPELTRQGDALGLLRVFFDKAANDAFLKNKIPQLFWYCRGVTAKPNVGEVLIEHPTDLGPDGHRAPLLVAGRFGGRTLFSAMDDSWRWRFYTGEHVFDSYWIQQLRYLARNRKIDQRRLALGTDQPVYELASQVRISLRVADPGLIRQLPDQLRVQLKDAEQNPTQLQVLTRQDGNGGEIYSGSFIATNVGRYSIHLPPIASGIDSIESSFEVVVPKLELIDPSVDHVQLSRLASETLGKTISLSDAESELEQIPSAQKSTPLVNGNSLWDAPLMLFVFSILIATEWVVRKLSGMV
jgi:uncharacterized membrane protein